MHQLGVLATPKDSWWGTPDGCTSNTKTQLVGRNYELKHRNPKAKRDDEQSVGGVKMKEGMAFKDSSSRLGYGPTYFLCAWKVFALKVICLKLFAKVSTPCCCVVASASFQSFVSVFLEHYATASD